MKVKELIELLEEYNPDAEVFIDCREVDISIDDSSGLSDAPHINLST